MASSQKEAALAELCLFVEAARLVVVAAAGDGVESAGVDTRRKIRPQQLHSGVEAGMTSHYDLF